MAKDDFSIGIHIPILSYDFTPEEIREADDILAQMMGGEKFYPGEYFDGVGPDSTRREPDPQGWKPRYTIPKYDVLAKIKEILDGQS